MTSLSPTLPVEAIELYDEPTAPLRNLEFQEIPVCEEPRNIETSSLAGLGSPRNLVFDICAAAAESFPQPKPRRPPTRSLSWKGHVAEALFEWRAMSLNLVCARPCTDGLPFDRLIITRRGRYTVQVKQTAYKGCAGTGRGWVVNLTRPKGIYKRGDFDFLAALIPDETWFIIPFSAIEGYRNLTLPRVHSQIPNRFLQYREAWHLFE